MTETIKLWYVERPCRTSDGDIYFGDLMLLDCKQVNDSKYYEFNPNDGPYGRRYGVLNRELFKDKQNALDSFETGIDDLAFDWERDHAILLDKLSKLKNEL